MKRLNTAALLFATLGFSAGVVCEEPAAPVAATAPAAAPVAASNPAATEPDMAPALCISLRRIQSTRILDERTILFEMSGNSMMINRLPRRCPGLKPQKGFGYKTSLSQLCNTDIIWVLENFGGSMERGASCGLGKFEPYVQPEPVTQPDINGTLEPAPKS